MRSAFEYGRYFRPSNAVMNASSIMSMDSTVSIIKYFWIPVVIFLFWWLRNYWREHSFIDEFAGFRAYFLIGNLHQFKPEPRDWLDQSVGCAVIHNFRVFRVWCGTFPYLCVNRPEDAETILGTNKYNDKSREYVFVQAFLGLGLLTSSSEKWRGRRKLLTPTFHYDILKDFLQVFNKQGKILIQKLLSRVDQGPFDVYPYITLCALAVICESSMGNDIDAQRSCDSDYVRAIYRVNDIIHHRQKKPWFWPDWTFQLFGPGKEHDECIRIIQEFSEKLIQQRYTALTSESRNGSHMNGSIKLSNGCDHQPIKKRLTFLDLLIRMVIEGQLTLSDVREEVDTFVFEGHDTTSAGMNWALHVIGCNPEIQAKIHREVDAVFGDEDRDLEFEDLKELSYLECCLKETLRLFPSVPMFGRGIKDDCILDEKFVPKGTQVFINPYTIHRNPNYWPDPELFIPERFLPENSVGRHPYAYIPFSAGPRNCIGQRFALMEEKTLLSWIFRYFTVKSVHRRDQITASPELILRPINGVHIELQLRRRPKFST